MTLRIRQKNKYGEIMLKQYQWKNLNRVLLGAVLLLIGLGSVFIVIANNRLALKQSIGVAVALAGMAAAMLIDYSVWIHYAWVLYGINLILLVGVKLFGMESHGATRWFSLGSFGTFQPSEMTKIILIIFCACYLEKYGTRVNEPKILIRLACLLFLPIFLILIQTDLSTSADIVLFLAVVLFAGGLSYRVIGGAVAACIPLFAGLIWFVQQPFQFLLEDYQVNRILSFLNPSKYSSTEAYQQNNSIMAIGSGQLYGKGWYSDTITTVKDSNLVSEQQTDFIFSVIGEMTGFIGSIFIIAILALIVVQCMKVAGRAKDTGGRLIAIGVGSLIGIQSFINIGVATALLPNTGLPLPFVSYGISSLLSNCIGIGMVLNISLQRRRY